MRIVAAYDCLTITSLLQELDSSPTKGEIHLLAYLASLLSVYARRGEGASDWGYSFAATSVGAPFSEDLGVKIEELLSGGALTVAGTTIGLSQEGNKLQRNLSVLGLTKDRMVYLDSAIATIIAIPIGLVRAAFARDPVISLVAEHKHSRILASGSALARLYIQFDSVADVLGSSRRSLLAASVLWLTYQAEQKSVVPTE